MWTSGYCLFSLLLLLAGHASAQVCEVIHKQDFSRWDGLTAGKLYNVRDMEEDFPLSRGPVKMLEGCDGCTPVQGKPLTQIKKGEIRAMFPEGEFL